MLEFKLLKIPSDQHDPFFFIASQKEIEIYDIKNLGYKTIKTPLGKFKTIVLHRKVKDSKKEDTVYLASELNWLPVRIDHLDKKGRKMVAVIEKKYNLLIQIRSINNFKAETIGSRWRLRNSRTLEPLNSS